MPPLTDRQRIELGLPAWLWNGLVHATSWRPDPELPASEAKDQLVKQVVRLKTLLNKACDEAVDGLDERKRRQLNRRITRVAMDCSVEIDRQNAVKISLALYYFTKALLDSGTLELWEGSAMGEAMDLLFPAYQQGFDEARLDASAQKRARHMISHLNRAGFYLGVQNAVAA